MEVSKNFAYYVMFYTVILFFISFLPKIRSATVTNVVQNLSDCGRRLSPPHNRFIEDAEDAYLGEYPWHAAVFNKEQSLICGATIISNNTLLSAAQCFAKEHSGILAIEPFSNYAIMVGKVSSNMSNIDSNDTQKFNVKKIITPPYRGFVLFRGQSDIALIKIDGVITFSEKVSPICLFKQSYNNEINNTKYVETAGWGANNNGTVANILQKTVLSYFPYEKCHEKLPDGKNGTEDERVRGALMTLLTTDKCCAGNVGRALHQCDNGGGLVVKQDKDDRYYLVGIINSLPYDSIPILEKYFKARKLLYSTFVPGFLGWIERNL